MSERLREASYRSDQTSTNATPVRLLSIQTTFLKAN
jgi:hypothetical protein